MAKHSRYSNDPVQPNVHLLVCMWIANTHISRVVKLYCKTSQQRERCIDNHHSVDTVVENASDIHENCYPSFHAGL